MKQQKSTKQKLAERAVSRGSSGLYFIDDVLRNKNGATDAAFSRSWLILLSFNFELILKSILILESKHTTQKDILNEIKSHDVDKLSKIIDVAILSKYGINSIKKKITNSFIYYVVEMMNKKDKVIIQDLTDIRYDFIKDNLRKTEPDEIDRIKNEINILLTIVDKINKILYL